VIWKPSLLATGVLDQALGLAFKRWTSDAAFLYLLNETHL
jgi:hypothetical protein